MKSSRLCALVVTVIAGLMLSPGLLAQSTGDFRSFQNGNWNDVNSWERFNGSTWVNPAPNTPTSAEGLVTILGGDTIAVSDADSIDQLVIEGVLRVKDTLIIQDGTGNDAVVNGTVIMDSTAGRLSLSSIGTPDISFASGSFYIHAANGGSIPTATWGTGSTCLITGATSTAPGNANQNFHHFTWSCPGQTAGLNTGWNNNVIGGNVTVTASGSSQFRMTSNTYTGTVITINGDVAITGGALTSTGSSGAATYSIVVNGNVAVTGGNLGLSRGSGGNATWWINGDMSVSNATIQSSNSNARFVFAKHDTQTVTLAGVTNTGTFQYEIDTSTTVILADGADAVDWTVTDSLMNRGILVTTGAVSFPNGSVYVHAQNGGSIPLATWATGSTCEITGVTSTAPANRAQDFYNFTWNCPGQSANLNMGWQGGTNIGGTLTVTNSNWDHVSNTSPSRQFRLFGAAGSCTIGNIVVNGYNAVLTPQGSAYADTVTVTGDITLSNGGMLSMSNSSGGITQYLVHGNFTVLDSAYLGKSSATNASRFVFLGQNKSYNTPSTGVTYFSAPNFVVASGSSLDLGASVLSGDGSFQLESGAVLGSGHADGLNGNVVCTGANGGGNLFSKLAVYAFNGTSAQVTGSFLPDSASGLIVDNGGGVTLSDTLMASDVTFTKGTLTLGANVLVADTVKGGSDSSYVLTDAAGNLTLKSIGNVETQLPIGTANSYAPVWVTNHGTPDAFTVSVAADNVAASAGGRVRLKWSIAEGVAGGSASKLKFGWMASQEDAAMVSDRPNSINFFKMTDTTEIGKGYYTTQFVTEPHTAARDSVDSFGPIALGRFKSTATAVEENASLIPAEFQLQQNFPNPFNPSTTIKYDIPKASHVSIRIYDALGRMVTELVNSDHQPGFHWVVWNAEVLPSGVYYYRIVAGEFVSVKKLLLVK